MSVPGGSHRIQFGTSSIEYELMFSDRKTLAIHVYPDGSVVVDAPEGSELAAIEQKVLKRAPWILRQQREFASYASPNPLPRRYVSGESYRYLGRQYRLKVVEDAIGRVILSQGLITVHVHDSSDKKRIQELLDDWYLSQAKRVLTERLKTCYPRVEGLGIPYPDLVVRDMKARWGSCSAKGRITLNRRLIYVPKDLMDYVILHELCHLKEHNHSPAFYILFERILPDWKERRQKLNQIELR